MIEAVTSILGRCSTGKTNICPTILYNEGWMTRLLVEISVESKLNLHDLDFANIRHWYSEGLLSSPFLARTRKDVLAEGFTHADMALGDFQVDSANRGDISVNGSDGIFGVIEAKMGSRLSPGTKNVPNYNQASRNLGCIAFNTLNTQHNIFFGVVAPEKKIEEHGIRALVEPEAMLAQITQRFDMYDHDSDIYALKERVLERARNCRCFVLTYEAWTEALADHPLYSALVEFKEQCYRFNRIG
nr:hypothetical protein [uncultured Desulfobulbus sp.]